MTPQQKAILSKWILTPAVVLTALGWGVTQIDQRFVHVSTYEKAVALDSSRRVQDSIVLARLSQKVDSANVRLQQIICGRRIDEGCR